MIKIENFDILGWEHAIRGMRNPMNSWDKSDSVVFNVVGDAYNINGDLLPDYSEKTQHLESNRIYGIDCSLGKNDYDLMMKLADNGPVHAKYRRMIIVYADITAPLYWWKEFDTYKVGTVANSCSTMHKIHEKEFTLEDFSCEHLYSIREMAKNFSKEDETFDPAISVDGVEGYYSPVGLLNITCQMLNFLREKYNETKNKDYWRQMIQLLPSSYNQKRTVMLNYEVLSNIYKYRKNHKLNEWIVFCEWVELLPYSSIITGEKK